MQIVACSPLTKIFLPEWEERIMENPEIVLDEVMPFKFTVPRSVGAVEDVHYGIPFSTSSKINVAREGSKAAIDLQHYLSSDKEGRFTEETNWTGIVPIQTTNEAARNEVYHAMMQAQMSKDEKKIAKAREYAELLAKREWDDQQEAIKVARKLANERVMTQVKITHRNLMQQYKHNTEDGKGLYTPSSTEHFGAYVLRELIQQSKARRQMSAQFKTWIEEIGV